jgi:photosystem II stability/assembly factor-like uncharacterized protein
MKKIIDVFVIILLGAIQNNAQWHQIGENPIGVFSIVKFADENIGWGCRNDPMKIFKTTDGGASWSVNFEPWAPITSIFFLDANHGWFSHISGNLLYTSNGGENWVVRYPAQNWYIEDIIFFDTLNGIACGSGFGGGEIYKTTNGGAIWELVYTPSLSVHALSFLNDTVGWCGGNSLYKTTDAGSTWTPMSGNVGAWIAKIKFLNESVGWLSTYQSNNLYFTSDGGNSWELKISSIVDFWFTDVNYGWYNTSSKIFHTTNNGLSWEEQYSDTSNNLDRLYFMNSEFGWVVKSNGIILHTINGGTPVELTSFTSLTIGNNLNLNWQTATETNNLGFEIERLKEIKSEIFNDWERIGFINGNGTTTEPKTYSFVDENLSAGKYQYRLKQIDFDGTFEYSNTIEVDINLPETFALENCFPNPFNPSTKIKYEIPKQSRVLLRVYDILGNEVITLVNEIQSAGSYQTIFDASELSSGVYIYKIEAGDFIGSKKMVLLK